MYLKKKKSESFYLCLIIGEDGRSIVAYVTRVLNYLKKSFENEKIIM